MKLNTPSYGVFMVDVFASSVGIFILVSLLYIIESAKATSDEVMAEKFKTLVKRDKVPVDRYSMPASRDPLHDWGIRARHARDKEEALILLLRDKVLLYHTMQTLDKEQIVDSDAIRQYFDKYNKGRRLILEIHYHDAYHYLKAKINESLPPDVRLWIHWAYNAGNIANPNPVFGPDNTNRVNMSDANKPFDPNAEENQFAAGSSTAPLDSTGEGSSANGNESGQSSGSEAGGSGNSDESSSGEGGSAEGGQDGGSEQGSETGQSDGTEVGSGESGDGEFTLDGSTSGDGQDTVEEAISEQMEALATAEAIVEQLMQPRESSEEQSAQQPETQPTQDSENGQANTSSSNTQGSGTGSGSTSSQASSDSQDNPPKSDEQKNHSASSASKPNKETKAEALSNKQLAQMHIQKNVFISVPLFSPISDFQLDVQVPGFDNKRFAVNAVRLKIQTQPSQQSRGTTIDLTHGDAIIPESSTGEPGWVKVKIIKVTQPGNPVTGWVYGGIFREILMLPLFENKVQSISTENERYWFKHENHDVEGFNTQATEAKP